MSIAHSVQFSVDRPGTFERVEVLLRVGICFVLSWLSSFGLWVILLAGPIISAVLISQRGAEGFHERSGAMYRKASAS